MLMWVIHHLCYAERMLLFVLGKEEKEALLGFFRELMEEGMNEGYTE